MFECLERLRDLGDIDGISWSSEFKPRLSNSPRSGLTELGRGVFSPFEGEVEYLAFLRGGVLDGKS